MEFNITIKNTTTLKTILRKQANAETLRDDHRGIVTMICFVLIVLQRKFFAK